MNPKLLLNEIKEKHLMNKANLTVAVYDSHQQAEEAVHQLGKAGFDMKTISILGFEPARLRKIYSYSATAYVEQLFSHKDGRRSRAK